MKKITKKIASITTLLLFCITPLLAQSVSKEGNATTEPSAGKKVDQSILPQSDNTSYENSVWVEDWTVNLDDDYYIQNLPRGVNNINVFVGQLALVNGVPSINGYSLDTPGLPPGTGAFPNVAALTDFVQGCKAAGITVKLSIGGQPGTTFGNSWNVLTADNVTGFAQAMVNLCRTTGADGADFDEELEDTNVAALAGQMAGKFKDIAPDLATSYCVYGGCDASGPWHATNTIFLQYAVTANNWCAIDRVAVMTYYDGCPLAQNEGFMTSWNTWLKQQHGFTPIRISSGVDPNDPTTSPSNGSLTTWIQFAAANGFSTAIWDQLGVDDYVKNDWGTVINNIYSGSYWKRVSYYFYYEVRPFIQNIYSAI
ncbi:MAG: hypothetical protein ACH346_00470 [Chthoniobacterales bacterium]